MAGHITAGADALVMDPRDDVATAIKDLGQGAAFSYLMDNGVRELACLDDIPFGHKVAIRDIPGGTNIRKYGEIIGRTTQEILAGQHVHVHNVEGIRGRGDQAGA